MRHVLHILVVVLSLGIGAHAQEKKPVAPPVVTSTAVFYPLTVEDHVKARDIQHQHDQLEVENQKMLIRIEQNKARQKDLLDQIRSIAFDFALSKKIDLGKFELNLDDMRFQERRK